MQSERDCKSRCPKGAPQKFAKTTNEKVAILDNPMLEMSPKAGQTEPGFAAAASTVPSSAPSTSQELNDMVAASMQQQAGGFAKSVFKSIEGEIMGLVTNTVSDNVITFGTLRQWNMKCQGLRPEWEVLGKSRTASWKNWQPLDLANPRPMPDLLYLPSQW